MAIGIGLLALRFGRRSFLWLAYLAWNCFFEDRRSGEISKILSWNLTLFASDLDCVVALLEIAD